VKLVFNVDVDYEIVRTQLTHNVVAIVLGPIRCSRTATSPSARTTIMSATPMGKW